MNPNRLAERWSLTLGDPYPQSAGRSWVAPCRDQRGRALVLKVAHPGFESRDEASGLTAWAGCGVVRLVRAEQLGDGSALLLERCEPGTPLAGQAEPEQDVVIAALLRRLWIDPPSGHEFRPLRSMCDAWARSFELELAAGRVRLDAGLARAGIELFRTLASDADRHVLLATDLHAGNVLAAAREPWLVIDPKPYVGDPTYDALQHMLNCRARLQAEPEDLVRRMADLCGLDRDRLLLWLFARSVQESPGWPWLADVARRLAYRAT